MNGKHQTNSRPALFLLCTALLLQAALLLQGCQNAPRSQTMQTAAPVAVSVSQTALAAPAACEGRFIEKTLLFAHGTRLRQINTYESNGAGMASGDLDGDGLLDLVFASIDGYSTIFWNQGGMQFRKEELDDRFTRGVTVVDVDGDGLLDITFTHRSSESVSYWRNQGAGAGARFALQPLPGVEHSAYALAWGDLNADGSLDLVTGAYDVEMRMRGLSDEEIQAQGGVVLYEQHKGVFTPHPLGQQSQTLSIALVDVNGDGQRDIWAANDFALPDGVWLSGPNNWKPAAPFQQTSHSTMSIEWGDLDNNGKQDFFTTDMNPGNISPEILAVWLPVLDTLEEKHGPKDPQIMANVLQVPTSPGRWRDDAPRRGVDATGWSWSAKFGDLNNDGFLDLYIVNGMIAENLFRHLPYGELVEENQTYRNTGRGSFIAAPEWGLGSKSSGRSMLLVDLNNDGALDVVINNLRKPAQLFENRLCAGEGLEVELSWPGSGNSYALGARLALRTDRGTFYREVRSTSGYLSGEPPRVHFGYPANTRLVNLRIEYPDGAAASIDLPPSQTLIKVTR